jgi:hypothetical protein
MTDFMALITGGGPHDGDHLILDKRPRHEAQVIAPDGSVYQYCAPLNRFVFMNQRPDLLRDSD